MTSEAILHPEDMGGGPNACGPRGHSRRCKIRCLRCKHRWCKHQWVAWHGWVFLCGVRNCNCDSFLEPPEAHNSCEYCGYPGGANRCECYRKICFGSDHNHKNPAELAECDHTCIQCWEFTGEVRVTTFTKNGEENTTFYCLRCWKKGVYDLPRARTIRKPLLHRFKVWLKRQWLWLILIAGALSYLEWRLREDTIWGNQSNKLPSPDSGVSDPLQDAQEDEERS